MNADDTHALATAPLHVSTRMLGQIGERFAASLSTIQAALRSGGAAALVQVQTPLAELERLGVQLQQLSRLLALDGLAPQEAVDLGVACRQAAATWQARADAAKVRLQVDGEAFTATLNAAALEQMLGLLIEHGLAGAESIRLSTTTPGRPLQPGIRVDITQRRQVAGEPVRVADEEALLPTLAGLLARSSGLLLHHTRLGSLSTWQVSPPAPRLDPLLADESAGLIPRTPVAVGGRILVVDPHGASRMQAHRLLTAAGMVVRAVETVAQARAALGDDAIDVLISGLPPNDQEGAELVAELRAGRPSLRVIELVDTENAFSFSLSAADAPGQLSRDELEAHLTAAVSEEIQGSKA